MKTRFKILWFVLLLLTGSLQAKPKYAVGLFHFNLQYVAGDYRIENRIIRESLYPVLQFFKRHPAYKADIEIQGYAIEVLAEEHPEVLKLLKKLVKNGQIELVIAHYSDQFFIAYPALDLQRSIEISDEILAQHGLRRSRVFFGQEIQWSPALATALQGKYDVVVTSADPHGYYRGKTEPLVNVHYGKDSILAWIGGGSKNLTNLAWTWSFLDDGEVFNTTDYNSNFYRVPEQERKNVAQFEKLKNEGYRFVTISELVNMVKKDAAYKIPDYPFVPEGTWNMPVGGPFLWMGKQRSGVETDGITRSLSYELRGKILLAEKLIAEAKKRGYNVSDLKQMLLKAWRHLLLSEVSDSSGWTPLLVEVQYTANEVADAMMIVRKILDQLRGMLKMTRKPVLVDTRSGRITAMTEMKEPGSHAAHLPVSFSVRAGEYKVEVRQFRENLYRLDIHCARPEDGIVEIAFQTAEQGLIYSPGCGENGMVEIPTDLKHDPILALANGFLYLGNGFNLIKDCTVEHLAATWRVKQKKVVFREELHADNPGTRMRFYILKGSAEEGLVAANRLNVWPSFLVHIADGEFKSTRVLPEMWKN